VVLNSVMQYFPNLEYMLKVLRSAARAVAPGGSIFIGDVRNLALLEAFELSKVMRKPNRIDISEALLNQVRSAAEDDEELVVDPRLFYSIAAELGATGAEIQLKRGRHTNELTCFRYDVVLHMGVVSADVPCPRFDWQRDAFSLDRLMGMMESGRPESFIVEGVPNARILLETRFLEKLKDAPPDSTVAGLLDEVRADKASGMRPEAFWEAAEEYDYQARICFSKHPRVDCFDVVLSKAGAASAGDPAAENTAGDASAWQHYVNNPLRSLITRRLAARVRESLSTQLPDYMVPSSFLLLDDLPLLPNGKLNRKALPARRAARHEQGAYAAPRTILEQALAQIWAEVLAVERVGVRDDFFADLGGHSLLATQLISRIREALPTDVPLKEVFQSPTVEQFAAALCERSPQQRDELERRAGLLIKLRHMSEHELDAALHDGNLKVMHA
jgi:acyl carrier protein